MDRDWYQLIEREIPPGYRYSCHFSIDNSVCAHPQLRGWTLRLTDTEGYHAECYFSPDGWLRSIGDLDVGATAASLSEQNADNLRWGIPDRLLVPACSRWEKSCSREWQRNPSPVTDLFERDIQPGDSFSCQFDIGVSRIKTNSRLWGWTIRRTAADGSTRECYFGENGLLESIAEATYKFDEKSSMRSEAIGKDYEVVYLYDENRNLVQVCENYYVLEDYCRDAPAIVRRFDPDGKMISWIEKWITVDDWDVQDYHERELDVDGNVVDSK